MTAYCARIKVLATGHEYDVAYDSMTARVLGLLNAGQLVEVVREWEA